MGIVFEVLRIQQLSRFRGELEFTILLRVLCSKGAEVCCKLQIQLEECQLFVILTQRCDQQCKGSSRVYVVNMEWRASIL